MGKKFWKVKFTVEMEIEFTTEDDVDEEGAAELAGKEDGPVEKYLQDQGINGEVDYGYSFHVESAGGPWEARVNVRGEPSKWRIFRLDGATEEEARAEMQKRVQEKFISTECDPETAVLREHRIFN